MQRVASPLTGVVAEVLAAAGAAVPAGAPVLLLESMKMHHEVVAPAAGVVRELDLAAGDEVREGAPLFALEPGGVTGASGPGDAQPRSPDVRDDLEAVLARRAGLRDAARPDAIARVHDRGRRTARENVEDLCDPGTFSEYGGLAVAAQRARRSAEALIATTPGDGMVCGVGEIGGTPCAVLAYDYTVLAGTQGARNHRKTDRLLELARERRLPVVLFAEGGGGRPGDTESGGRFHLDVPTFHTFASLSGLVPRIGIVSGRCFAGNAALLGCCDVILATPDATVGMGGPAMIEGGGLGRFAPEAIGPVEVQAANGVLDGVCPDEAAAVAMARSLVALLSGGTTADWACADQRGLRAAVPEDPKRVHDARALLEGLCDTGSVLELRPAFGRTLITALARLDGRPVGVLANDPAVLSGALDADGSDKGARFLALCDAFGLPVLSLVDTPGFMVGPEAERTATVRHTARLFQVGATLSVPLVCVIVRRAFGLGAQAMAGGHLKAPALTVAWPTGELGAMGVEGAVKLAQRKELEAIADPDARAARVAELVAAVRAQSTALEVATVFELDDVIDPADTRDRIAATLRAAAVPPLPASGRRRVLDSW